MDIIRAGRDFKYAQFLFINRIYRGEVFPDETEVTILTMIWKQKGQRSKLKSNRFIHSKEPVSKVHHRSSVKGRTPRDCGGRKNLAEES